MNRKMITIGVILLFLILAIWLINMFAWISAKSENNNLIKEPYLVDIAPMLFVSFISLSSMNIVCGCMSKSKKL
jgi:hypothetical protein